MATTLADLKQRVKNNLYSSAPHEHPFVALLNESGFDATETDVTLDTNVGASFTAGDVLEIEAEQMFVVSVSGDVLTVVRGWNGTTGAAHADNTPMTKNPRFTDQMIEDAILGVVSEFEDWGVHAFGTGSLTLVANQTYYDLTDTDINEPLGVLSVYYPATTSLIPVELPFRWIDKLHTTVSTTGHGLHLWNWGDKKAGDTVYYTYAQDITTTTTLSDHQDQLLVAGATAAMLGATIGPATHDPGARTDRTVSPGQTSRDVRYWQSVWFIGMRAEAAHLAVERARFKPSNSVRLRRAQRWRS
jgi:hypothetical protein